MTSGACAWCRGPIPAGARRDSITCSKRCRQARHRFVRGVGVAPRSAARIPLRLAYADPPYPGKASYYEGHRDYAGEVDHAALIRRLSIEYDGWALSTSAEALQAVLALCPPGVRVASWHRGERPGRSLAPLNAWEPVIYSGGRLDPELSPVDVRRVAPDVETSSRDLRRVAAIPATHPSSAAAERIAAEPSRDAGVRRVALAGGRDAFTWSTRRLDALVYASRPRLTDPDRVIGAKPAVFAGWMFTLLGALPIDTLDDLYPGSGGISRAWAVYTASTP